MLVTLRRRREQGNGIANPSSRLALGNPADGSVALVDSPEGPPAVLRADGTAAPRLKVSFYSFRSGC